MKGRSYPYYKDSGIEWLGEIPRHWETKALKRVLKTLNGLTPKSSEPEYWDGDIPWATPDDLGSLKGHRLDGTQRMITKAGYESCGTSIAPKGSLILSTRAPIGHLAIADRALCTNQGCRSLVFRRNDDTSYFYYQLLSCRSELESWGQGSTFKELGRNKLESIYLVYPPISEQSFIAKFLDRETERIDKLIAKKERQIELLQEKRAALISHAVTRGLNPNAKMKDSGIKWLGKIPEHWLLVQLRRVVGQFVDYRGSTPEKVDSGVRLITAKNIKDGSIDLSLSEEYMREDQYAEWMVRGWPAIGDVLVTTEAPLGEVAQVFDPTIALAQRVILLKVNKTVATNEFLKWHIMSDFGQGELWSRATGSTALGIKADRLKETLVALPPIQEQVAIARFLDKQIDILQKPLAAIQGSIEKLREYRTALISAAVTGKIDLRKEGALCINPQEVSS